MRKVTGRMREEDEGGGDGEEEERKRKSRRYGILGRQQEFCAVSASMFEVRRGRCGAVVASPSSRPPALTRAETRTA